MPAPSCALGTSLKLALSGSGFASTASVAVVNRRHDEIATRWRSSGPGPTTRDEGVRRKSAPGAVHHQVQRPGGAVSGESVRGSSRRTSSSPTHAPSATDAGRSHDRGAGLAGHDPRGPQADVVRAAARSRARRPAVSAARSLPRRCADALRPWSYSCSFSSWIDPPGVGFRGCSLPAWPAARGCALQRWLAWTIVCAARGRSAGSRLADWKPPTILARSPFPPVLRLPLARRLREARLVPRTAAALAVTARGRVRFGRLACGAVAPEAESQRAAPAYSRACAHARGCGAARQRPPATSSA